MAKIEIQDTGLDSIGGSEIYTKATTGWIDMKARTMRPEIDVVGTNYQTQRLSGDELKPVNNTVESVNPTRITITSIMRNAEDVSDIEAILKMSRTRGLKQIRGGLGSLAILPGSQADDTVYVNIKAIKPVENISDSNNTMAFTFQLEVVE